MKCNEELLSFCQPYDNQYCGKNTAFPDFQYWKRDFVKL